MSLADLERRAVHLDAPVRGVPVEYRDPKAATQSLRWVTPGRAQPPDWDAANAFQIAYYSNVVVYACVRVLANTLAALPFRAGADPDTPTDWNPNAPLARLLGPAPGGPAPKLSARRLWAWTVAQRVVTGRYGWEIEYNRDTVAALWPLASSALVPVPSLSGTQWFTGFEYGPPARQKHLKPDEIVYGWNPRGDDFRQPESDLQAAHLDVSVAVMQDRYDYAFLKNDARPAALVVTEAFAERQDFEAFKSQWNSQYQGPGNAGKTAFIEAEGGDTTGVSGAVDVKILGLNARDSQAAERYAAKLNSIAIALGVPWSLLDASGRTYDNAGQEIVNFWQNRMIPMLVDLQDEINMQLAPKLGSEVGWFDLSKVVALKESTDPVSAKVGANTLLLATIMTRNEARADYGLEPVDGGDVLLSPEEIQALTGQENPSADAAGSPTTSGGGSPSNPSVEPPDVDEKPESDTEGERSVPRLARQIRRRRANSKSTRRQDRIIRRWEGEWQEFFERQGRSVIARLKSNRGRRAVAGKESRGPADEIFDSLSWLDQTMKLTRKMVIDAAEEGTDDYLGRFGIDFDLKAPGVTEFVDSRVNQLAGHVTDTTYGQIKTALNEGISLGESIPDLSARVEHVFEVGKSRATTIARTEVIGSYNGAASARASALPADVVGGQEWLATNDDRCREAHLAADGQVVSVVEAFDVDGEPLQYPGDPSGSPENVVNCRCTVAFLTPEEYAELAPERTARADRARRVLNNIRSGEALNEDVVRLALEVAA